MDKKMCKMTDCMKIEGTCSKCKSLAKAKAAKSTLAAAKPKTPKNPKTPEKEKGKEKKKKKEPINKLATDTANFQKAVRAMSEGFCVTCNYTFDSETDRKGFINAGHFIPRGRHATRLLFINCHPQCATCNSENGSGKNGRVVEHSFYVNKTYGWVIKEMIARCPEIKEKIKGKSMSEILVEISNPVFRMTAEYRRSNKALVKKAMTMLKEGWSGKDVRVEMIRAQLDLIIEFYKGQ